MSSSCSSPSAELENSTSVGHIYGYHHTSQENAISILEEGYLNPSLDTESDAVLGPGVYITEQSHINDTLEDVAMNNYGSADGTEYAEVILSIPIEDQDVIHGQNHGIEGRDVSVIVTDSPLPLPEGTYAIFRIPEEAFIRTLPEEEESSY